MGYFEVKCTLCLVSFAIARIRRIDEPEDAAWSWYGYDYVEDESIELEPHVVRLIPSYLEPHELRQPPEPPEMFPHDITSPTCTGCTVVNRGIAYGCSGQRWVQLEHIAGPGCNNGEGSGYSGHRISLEEMEGCRRVQCLYGKDEIAGWHPESDDEEFERIGTHFLSGYGYGSPDCEPLTIDENVRHGLESVSISNSGGRSQGQGTPFHPTCFDLFRRACIGRLGFVDAQGLVDFHDNLTTKDVYDLPTDPAVDRGTGQWWKHVPGDEWLVANPIKIPGLREMLDLYKRSAHTTPIASTSCENGDTNGHFQALSLSQDDPFMKLPRELLDSIILDHGLSSTDVANLQLSTRAARVIPAAAFRRFIIDEMPWFYEAEEHLCLADTDWQRLYQALKRDCLGEAMGLKNRRRIWKAVNDRIDWIDALRKEGKIDLPVRALH